MINVVPRERQPAPRAELRRRKHATRDDVCRLAGVSTATVSRVLNDNPNVRPEVREKVLAAARQLNYVPHVAARILSRARSDTLGVVFQDLTAGWFLTIFRGVMNRASGSYHILNALSTRAGDEFDLPNRMLTGGRVDGLIWLDLRVTDRTIAKIKAVGMPFVIVQRNVSDPDVSAVYIENRYTAADAVRHLLDLGYRRLAVLTGPPESEDSHAKMAGVEMALRERELALRPEDVLVGHHVATHAVKALTERMKIGPLPEALFAFNDEMAIAAVLWLRERGIRVPEDVAIVGFDGIPEAKYLGLTTVENPLYEMGVIAAQTLIDTIEDPSGKREARHIVLNGRLCVRETCGARLRQA